MFNYSFMSILRSSVLILHMSISPVTRSSALVICLVLIPYFQLLLFRDLFPPNAVFIFSLFHFNLAAFSLFLSRCNVWVSGLSQLVSASDLKTLFSPFGQVCVVLTLDLFL